MESGEIMDPEMFLLQMSGISKKFPGTQALEDVDFNLKEKEVHALVGENGAGKSTLMNILNGLVRADAGKIVLNGKEVTIHHPLQARRLGISFIQQELELAEPLSVKENIVLGKEPLTGFPRHIAWGKLDREVRLFLAQWNFNLDPNAKVADLSIAERQMTEIAKALFAEAKIIVMDEPTATLSSREVEYLFTVIRTLKKTGHAVIYISHMLEEIFEIADRVTVLRNGHYVGTKLVSTTNRDEVIKMMVGKDVKERFIREPVQRGELIMQVHNLSTGSLVRDVSFELHQGEVLGIAGLVGSGRTELLEALYGYRPLLEGRITIAGKRVRIRSPRDAIKVGLYYLPEDRRGKGLFLTLNVLKNIGASSMEQHIRYGLISQSNERKAIKTLVNQLSIHCASVFQKVAYLSGGNQQKVVIAKSIKAGFKVIMLNEPTRGIDVGSKLEIYQLINAITRQGSGVLLVSSELPEVMGMSDRIIVMNNGRITGFFRRNEFKKETIMAAMFRETSTRRDR